MALRALRKRPPSFPALAPARIFAFGKKAFRTMLEIRVNDIPLELSPDTDVQITASNPILDKDAIERTFSYPFKVPASPNNRRTREHRNRLDAASSAKSQPGSLTFQSQRLVTGLVEQTGFSREQEEIVCVSRPMKIWEALGKIKIHEILETIDVTAGRPAPAWTFGMGTLGTYEITIAGEYYARNAASFPGIPAAAALLVADINADFPGMASYDAGGNALVLDGLLVDAHPIDSFDTLVLNSRINPADWHYNNMKLHVTNVNATPVATHCFPVIRWENAYSGKLTMPYEIANHAYNGIFLENQTYDTEYDQWQHTIVPCVKVPYILNRIAAALGTHTFSGEVFDDSAIQKAIIPNNYCLDQVIRAQYSDLLFYKRNAFKRLIQLGKHVPQMTAAEFISRLCNHFALWLDITEDQLVFQKKQARIAQPANDIANDIDVEYTVSTNRTNGWKLAHLRNPKEELAISGQFTDITVDGGEAVTEIPQSFYMGGYFLFNIAKMPATRQPLLSNVFDTSAANTSMPFTLLFFYGIQTYTPGFTSAYASSDNTNGIGTYVGPYTLDISGPDGLYERWHKGIIEASVADVVSIAAYLTIGQLQRLLTWSSARVHFYHHEGSITGLLKTVQASLREGWRIATRLEILRP